jgi:hypothetical protein
MTIKQVLLTHSEDGNGYPNMAFELFYQQGLNCYAWRLPRHLVRQAFKHLCFGLKEKGLPIRMWQIRAFVYGCHGLSGGRQKDRYAAADYQWPTPPDASWDLIICHYPNGVCEIDFAHPVSRAFWSDQNEFLSLPADDGRRLNCDWFETMGFELMPMMPLHDIVTIQVDAAPHLRLV